MDAVISGCAGKALLILDDRSLISIEVRDPNTFVKRREDELPFLFGDATDLIFVENVEIDEVKEGLQNEFEFACALDLILLSLNSDARSFIREEAVEQLEQLLSRERVAARLRDLLYLRPLPDKADVTEAIACCQRRRTTKTADFLRKLHEDQPVIRQIALLDEVTAQASQVIRPEQPNAHSLDVRGHQDWGSRDNIRHHPDDAPAERSLIQQIDFVCFSHLRWDFVYQRPQHLLTRFGKKTRVFFIEEPIFGNVSMRLDISEREEGLRIIVPHLPDGLRSEIAINAVLREMVSQLFIQENISEYVLWYYTPMALKFSDRLSPIVTVYDCMDELSTFKGAHSQLPVLEKQLLQQADLVFTGGHSLYEAKRNQHPAVYAFPSSIDDRHFRKARTINKDPEDQAHIPHPRLGFFGVIDERFDIDLLEQVATKRPHMNFIMIGPVVKIDPDTLPKLSNIHYLGGKKYHELPDYLAGWDIALLLFARNESTRFISPTKTAEYLAAGKPVISTSIQDVVRPYGELKLVEIADTPDQFIQAAEKILSDSSRSGWLTRVDAFLEDLSWDRTWSQMSDLISSLIETRRMNYPSDWIPAAASRFYVRRIASSSANSVN